MVNSLGDAQGFFKTLLDNFMKNPFNLSSSDNVLILGSIITYIVSIILSIYIKNDKTKD